MYFDIDFNDVNNANRVSHPGLMYYSQAQDANSYAIPSDLNSATTYYWRIDEVNGASIWKGNVWRFTIRDFSLADDFEQYVFTGIPARAGGLRRTWIDGRWGLTPNAPPPAPPESAYSNSGKNGAFAQLNLDPNDGQPKHIGSDSNTIVVSGTKSMKLYYDNGGYITWDIDLNYYSQIYWYTAPKFSEVIAAIDDDARIDATKHDSLGMKRDWSGYKLLKVSFYGDPNNEKQPLYVGLSNQTGGWAAFNFKTVNHPDPNAVQLAGWNDWYIPLTSFTAGPNGIDLTNVTRIAIGTGNRFNQPKGGAGAIFIDEVQLLANSVCIPGSVTGDFTNDCRVDTNDLDRMADFWLGQMPTRPNPDPNLLIHLDASSLALSPPNLTNWPNTGYDGGSFVDFNTPHYGI